MTIYLVRHGETAWNTERKYQGRSDVPLSELGIMQAKQLAARFEAIPLSAVYASDLTRAFQTAEIIARPHNLEVGILPEFSEINFGEWEGLSASEIESRYGADYYQQWLNDPGNVPIPGGETLQSVLSRTLTGINRLFHCHQGETVLVVTHGGNIMALGCYINGEPLSSFWNYYQGNSAVCTLEFDGNQLELVAMNDLSHLQE